MLTQAKKRVLDKDYKGAVSLLTEALVLDPENADAKFYRALSQLDSGMHQDSIGEFREMISNRTHSAEVCYILLSIAYKRANDSQMSFNTVSQFRYLIHWHSSLNALLNAQAIQMLTLQEVNSI